MPFQSKAQMQAAFAGGLGPEMQAKAEEFARATPNLKALPEHVGKKKTRQYRLVEKLKGR